MIFAVRKYHRFAAVKLRDIPELNNIIITAIPLFIGNSALQINQIVDKSITSGLGEGAASALSYCHTLEQFVTNIMIVNIGNVMFANFAEFVAKREFEDINKTLSKAINILISLLAGISIITVICSKDIVTIVYYRGSFSQEAVFLTSSALIGYALSFVAVAVRDLSIKSLYAFRKVSWCSWLSHHLDVVRGPGSNPGGTILFSLLFLFYPPTPFSVPTHLSPVTFLFILYTTYYILHLSYLLFTTLFFIYFFSYSIYLLYSIPSLSLKASVAQLVAALD